jgi:DNA-binding MurR/RpiR family transcriptional regulator
LRQTNSDDVAVVIDQHRYVQWLLGALDILSDSDTHIVAFSDSPLSPLVATTHASFVVNAEGTGPLLVRWPRSLLARR